jgi:hypothetical protein
MLAILAKKVGKRGTANGDPVGCPPHAFSIKNQKDS